MLEMIKAAVAGATFVFVFIAVLIIHVFAMLCILAAIKWGVDRFQEWRESRGK